MKRAQIELLAGSVLMDFGYSQRSFSFFALALFMIVISLARQILWAEKNLPNKGFKGPKWIHMMLLRYRI